MEEFNFTTQSNSTPTTQPHNKLGDELGDFFSSNNNVKPSESASSTTSSMSFMDDFLGDSKPKHQSATTEELKIDEIMKAFEEKK